VRKTKEEAAETRAAILRSALDTFYEKGYSKTTFDEIARRINLTKGAVYWHFRNKPDLVAALINGYLERERVAIEEKLPVLRSFNDILNSFIYACDFLLSSESNRKLAFFMTNQMEWSEAMIIKVSSQIGRNTQNWRQHIEEGLTYIKEKGEISETKDVKLVSNIIINVWTGILGAYLGRHRNFDLKEMVTESLNLIFNGLISERTENAGK